jgi:hypothetical protein
MLQCRDAEKLFEKKKSSQYSMMRGVPWKSDDYSAGQEISCLHGNGKSIAAVTYFTVT